MRPHALLLVGAVLGSSACARDAACDAAAAKRTGIDPRCGPEESSVPVFAVVSAEKGLDRFIKLAAVCERKATAPTGELAFGDGADAVGLALPPGYRLTSAKLRIPYDLDLWAESSANARCEAVSQYQTVAEDAHILERDLPPESVEAFLKRSGGKFDHFDAPHATPRDPEDAERAQCAHAWTNTLQEGYERSSVVPIDIPPAPVDAAPLLARHRAAFEAKLAKETSEAPCVRAYWKGLAKSAKPDVVQLDAKGWTLTLNIATPSGTTIVREMRDAFVIGN
jgi:hypothetical protein